MMSKGTCTGQNKYFEASICGVLSDATTKEKLTGKTMTSTELSEALAKANGYDGDEWHLHLHGCNEPHHDGGVIMIMMGTSVE